MYINTTTLQSVSERDIRSVFPYTSFASPFQPPEGFAVLFDTPAPAHDPITHFARLTTPELTSKGVWEQRWEVVALDAETVAANTQAAQKRLQESIIEATQQRLDTFAQSRNYDSILSACTYATSTSAAFAAEGQRAVQLRDDTWAALYGILANVQNGSRPAPTGFSDIEAELPALTW